MGTDEKNFCLTQHFISHIWELVERIITTFLNSHHHHTAIITTAITVTTSIIHKHIAIITNKTSLFVSNIIILMTAHERFLFSELIKLQENPHNKYLQIKNHSSTTDIKYMDIIGTNVIQSGNILFLFKYSYNNPRSNYIPFLLE